MADVLDQNEIDALLAAASAGAGPSAAATATEAAPMPAWAAAPRRDVAIYDFKRPERVSKDQMRALEGIHDGFARNFGASLSGFLRTIVETRVAICEQLTFSEFIRSLPSPTCFNLLNCAPLVGQMCLEVSPLIIYPFLDRLLGGNSTDTYIPQRALTNIEQRLVGRITDRALASLTEVWSHLVQVKFELAETESNPQLVQIIAPNEVVVVVGFEIKLGPRSGTMSLCIPFNVIEPVMSKLATQSWLSYTSTDNRAENLEAIQRRIEKTHVGVTAFLAQTRLTVRDLFSLAPGDLVRLDKPVDGELLLQIEGRNKFAGRLGQHRGQRVLQITRPVKKDEIL